MVKIHFILPLMWLPAPSLRSYAVAVVWQRVNVGTVKKGESTIFWDLNVSVILTQSHKKSLEHYSKNFIILLLFSGHSVNYISV